MKMKNISLITTAFLIAVCWFSCTEEGRIDHIDPSSPAPTQISDIKIQSKPGGAIISYEIPDDPNFSYAKAVYEIQPGVYREAKASLYTDTLTLVGYGDTLTHKVDIYSVGKNEKESAPLTINVKALTPPVQSVFKTINLVATFGGVQLSFKNVDKADLALTLMVDTTNTGDWTTVETFYTGAPEGVFSARGFEASEKKFAIFVRDRWLNKSDTLVKSLTPVFEEFIPKTWKALNLPSDQIVGASTSYKIEYMWDGQMTAYVGVWASSNTSVLPQWFTVDLQQKVIISRIREHQQEAGHLYKSSAVKKFELWGSNNPDTNGGWNNWQLLGTFESFKPSGSPMGTNTTEDQNYGHFLGEEFSFDKLMPAVRYIRWKTLETYGSSGQVVIAEIDLYGQIVK